MTSSLRFLILILSHRNKEPSLTCALRIQWFEAYARFFVHKTAVYLLSFGRRKVSHGNRHYVPLFHCRLVTSVLSKLFRSILVSMHDLTQSLISSGVLLLGNTTYLQDVLHAVAIHLQHFESSFGLGNETRNHSSSTI